jgi:hypothetical protein
VHPSGCTPAPAEPRRRWLLTVVVARRADTSGRSGSRNGSRLLVGTLRATFAITAVGVSSSVHHYPQGSAAEGSQIGACPPSQSAGAKVVISPRVQPLLENILWLSAYAGRTTSDESQAAEGDWRAALFRHDESSWRDRRRSDAAGLPLRNRWCSTHHQALRALANRLVGILHGCLTHQRLYDSNTPSPLDTQEPWDI